MNLSFIVNRRPRTRIGRWPINGPPIGSPPRNGDTYTFNAGTQQWDFTPGP